MHLKNMLNYFTLFEREIYMMNKLLIKNYKKKKEITTINYIKTVIFELHLSISLAKSTQTSINYKFARKYFIIRTRK